MPDASGRFRGSGWSRAREDGWERAFPAGAVKVATGWAIYACPECNYVLPPGHGSGLMCSACYRAKCEPVHVIPTSARPLWGYSL